MDMINQLVAAKTDHTLLEKLQYYQLQDILVCDAAVPAYHLTNY